MSSKTKDHAVQTDWRIPFAAGNDQKTPSTALVEVSHETQVQRYVPGGPLVTVQTHEEEEAVVETNTSYKLVVADHGTVATKPHPDTSPEESGPNFLHWPTFEEAVLPPRENPKKSRRDRIFAPLGKLKVELPGEIGVEGFDGVFESVHALFHSAKRLDFMESERAMHLPPPARGKSAGEALPRRELERLENELFDMAKYHGDSNFLTALAWTEEGHTGSITLFEVLFGPEGETTGVRPVAAMQNVPNPVLVNMRTNEKIKRKLVFVPTTDDDAVGAFKWKANSSRGPSYARRMGNTNIKSSDVMTVPASHSRDRRSTSRGSHHSGHGGPRLADADGVIATIPQFVALLHANRSILEDIQSSSVSTVNTACCGDAIPAVTLHNSPRSNPHDGESVHVVVLTPNDAEWTDDEIFWTDRGNNPLEEFRRRRYWDLIERERTRRGSTASGSGSGNGHGGRERSRSRHSSSGGAASRHDDDDGDEEGRERRRDSEGTRSRSRHSPSRSRSRHHHLLHSLF
ncbi:hypothetical protein B0H63DRAFT_188170 [Podospora didyma]|uniref:Uncharacterized protein n=1 Tax=Podospora didyma TaxID=330526 RepID=A0AAE0NQJ6_9PEZI|nr:hypothetical protein B0H63DRAFT_188170 [Podospora didyma]